MKTRTCAVLITLGLLTAVTLIPATASADTVVVAVAADDFEPLFFDGYVVYFDDLGRPFIYVNGEVVYIPVTHAFYTVYVRHFWTHRTRYHRWLKTVGFRYRTFRLAKAHRGKIRWTQPLPRPKPTIVRTAASNRGPMAVRTPPANRAPVTRRAPAGNNGRAANRAPSRNNGRAANRAPSGNNGRATGNRGQASNRRSAQAPSRARSAQRSSGSRRGR